MAQIIYSLETIDEVVEELYSLLDSCAIFTFEGSLGAGKTTLIKKFLARCGIQELVTSPTFTYMAVYSNAQDQTFYHFDLYRIATLAEFMEAGFAEYLYVPNSWALIEWPEVIMPLLTTNVCKVSIDYYSELQRMLTYTVIKKPA